MNNLFVKGRRAAVIALLAAMPFAHAKAYDERAYMTSAEQTEYETNGTLPSDIEKKDDNKGAGALFLCVFAADALVCLSVFAGATWIVKGAIARKTLKDELRKSQKSFTL